MQGLTRGPAFLQTGGKRKEEMIHKENNFFQVRPFSPLPSCNPYALHPCTELS